MSRMPARRARHDWRSRNAVTSDITSSYSVSSCMVRGIPRMCMITALAPVFATTSIIAGSRNPLTSLTILAPATRHSRATAGFRVSTEMPTPTFSARARITGRTRSSSTASLTGRDPGRVLSPPTSIKSAPSATISTPRSTARATSRKRPPSENESGVTLRMPINSVRVDWKQGLRAGNFHFPNPRLRRLNETPRRIFRGSTHLPDGGRSGIPPVKGWSDERGVDS